jgi:hypothetical protein
MLGTIAIILAFLWVLGMIASYTMGGFIHVLVVVAVVLLAIRFAHAPHKKVHYRARH